YVIEKDSKENKRLEQLGQVLYYRSLKHIWLTIVANKIITSHHHELIYPLKNSFFIDRLNVTKYYLGHGVTAMKHVVAKYGKNAREFNTDYMIVSSSKEKEIIVNDYGYKPTEVLITGLPRFDNLFKNQRPPKRQILIIPTW